jgi:hypothetical protein
MYAIDPVQFLSNQSAANQALVLGGEITTFGESVDASNWDARTWTRAPPVAERLWSPASVTSVSDCQRRFSAMRCTVHSACIVLDTDRVLYGVLTLCLASCGDSWRSAACVSVLRCRRTVKYPAPQRLTLRRSRLHPTHSETM